MMMRMMNYSKLFIAVAATINKHIELTQFHISFFFLLFAKFLNCAHLSNYYLVFVASNGLLPNNKMPINTTTVHVSKTIQLVDNRRVVLRNKIICFVLFGKLRKRKIIVAERGSIDGNNKPSDLFKI